MTTLALSTYMLDRNRDVWDAMLSHRFIKDIAADRLPQEAFARYLVFEHGFVETAILIFGHAMLEAPGFNQRRRLIGVLHGLAEEQMACFREAFTALGIAAPSLADAPVPEPVRAFDRGMLEMAQTGGYRDILTIMLAAEWIYATWCSRIDLRRIASPEMRRWMALHAAPEFVEQAAWMRSEIDALGVAADAAERDRLSALFRNVMSLEIGFHHAAYDASWPVRRLKREDTPS